MHKASSSKKSGNILAGTAFLWPHPPSWQLYWTWRKGPECTEEESWCGDTSQIYKIGDLAFTIWFSGTLGYSFTVISWAALQIVKILQCPEMLAKAQVSAPGEGNPPWERNSPPALQVKATLPGDSSFRLQGRHTWWSNFQIADTSLTKWDIMNMTVLKSQSLGMTYYQ